MNPHLARIRIFPLKSLDGVAVDEAVVQRRSGLAGDREFCLVDENGDFVNTKRVGESLVRIRSEFDRILGEITLRVADDTVTFSLETRRRRNRRVVRKTARKARPIETRPRARVPRRPSSAGANRHQHRNPSCRSLLVPRL